MLGYWLGVELGLGFLVNVHTPQAENFSGSEFYLVLRVEPELHSFFLSVPTLPSALNYSLMPGQSGVFLHALVPPPQVN